MHKANRNKLNLSLNSNIWMYEIADMAQKLSVDENVKTAFHL